MPFARCRPGSQPILRNYGTFLTCRESAEVYWSNGKQTIVANTEMLANNAQPQSQPTKDGGNELASQGQNVANVYSKAPLQRKVMPQQQQAIASPGSQQEQQAAFSKFALPKQNFASSRPAPPKGTLARFRRQ